MVSKRVMVAGLLAGMALMGVAGPARADVVGTVGSYAKDRAHDFLDMFRLRGGYPRDGKGIGAKARVTSLAQLGYVNFDGTYVGLEKRGFGVVAEQRRETGVSVLYGSYNEMSPQWGNGFLEGDTLWSQVQDRRILRNLPHWDDGRQRHLSIGGELVLPVVALDAGIYPEEAFDFVLGFLTIDVFVDDELRGFHEPAEPTVLAEPDMEAPFAEKRQKLQEQEDRIKLEQMREYLEEAEGELPEEVDQALTPPAEEPSTEGAISSSEADQAIREADEMAPVDQKQELEVERSPEPEVEEEPEEGMDAPPKERITNTEYQEAAPEEQAVEEAQTPEDEPTEEDPKAAEDGLQPQQGEEQK